MTYIPHYDIYKTLHCFEHVEHVDDDATSFVRIGGHSGKSESGLTMQSALQVQTHICQFNIYIQSQAYIFEFKHIYSIYDLFT